MNRLELRAMEGDEPYRARVSAAFPTAFLGTHPLPSGPDLDAWCARYGHAYRRRELRPAQRLPLMPLHRRIGLHLALLGHRIRLAFLGFGLATILVACPSQPASSPTQATMRAALVLAAEAVLDADKICADTGESMRAAAASQLPPDRLATLTKARAIVHECSLRAHDAEDALLTGQSVLDTYDDAKAGNLVCAATRGVDALARITAIVVEAGGAVPAKVTDAIAALEPLTKIAGAATCPIVTKDAGGR